MILEVHHKVYGKCELNVSRVIALCPERKWILFEDTYWPLNDEDYSKVEEAFRKLFR